ncbi:canalicular multispecific organic anion transporter 1 [Plakobranchus ocellatus]|uniref:ABC-type glutathione-S-conjugate transporter n=1 Tax=Plakobranchus ocellatus TaxID=259542 RepID=A0AAV4D2D9_9GAST|nr:canalicular multispecific organic anion transporter 1 [Plakobranchus ocellatus]
MPMYSSFCGNSTFWNTSAVEDYWYPKFTECFQETALSYIPCGWLWLTAGFHLAYLARHTRYISLPVTWLHTARLVVAILLCVMCGIHLIMPVIDDTMYTPSFLVDHSLCLATYILACILMVLSRKSGVTSPCIVFLFWLFTLVTRSIPLYTIIFEKVYQTDKLKFYVGIVTFSLIALEFALQLVGDSLVKIVNEAFYKKPCPKMGASYISRLTYTWMHRLVYLGYKKVVVMSDIFDVPGYMQCRYNVPAFMAAWQQELRKKLRTRVVDKSVRNGGLEYANHADKPQANGDVHEPTEKTRLLPETRHSVDVAVVSGDKKGKPSLIRALAKVFFLPLIKAQLVGLIADALLYVNPLLLGELIAYIEDKDQFPKWKGYSLAVGFFVVVFLNSMMSNYRFYTCSNIGQRVKTVLTAAVYKKSLTMNAEARRNFTVGTIVNLMSVDCPRFRDVTAQMYVLISWPVQMCIAFYLLHDALGIAFLAGLVALLFLVPANAGISTMLRRSQARQLVLKDQRIKLVNEILNGVKVLKLYAWEPSFQKKILELRRLEVAQLRKSAILSSFNTLCWLLSPVMMTVTSFVAYVLVTGESLTPAKAFVAINLINNMRVPMNSLPLLISQLVQVQVSLTRLQDYLSGEELDDKDTGISSNEFPIQMRNSTYTWDRTMAPTLQNITLKIPQGKLVAVVGPVGAGKSSLLSAMLGEMEQLTGQSSLKGQVAYVPQQAWIQNMTLRNNILFEKPLEEDFYKKVLEVCALQADIDLLPGGEMTEIGEKGINLSGGQKQRISLARAVYQKAELYLLDDPLSAVDAHVGKHIFQKVIGPDGIIRNKTRVMVTHGVHWLPLVDAIIVMDQGRITEAGSYQELMTHDGPFAQFVRTYLLEHADDEVEDPEVQRMQDEIRQHVDSVTSDEEQIVILRRAKSEIHGKGPLKRTGGIRHKDPKRSVSLQEVLQTPKEATKSKSRNRLIEEEKVEHGQVRSAVYLALLRSFGYLPAFAVCFFLLLYNAANLASGIWLSEWTSDAYLTNETNEGDKYSTKTNTYLGVYAALASVQMIANGAFVMFIFVQMVTASHRLHNAMLNSILHQPMSFFDTTPVGRILNRFSRDVDVLDFSISRQLRLVLQTFFNLLVIVAIISYSTPIFLVVIAPVMVVYILFQRFYIPSSRQFRRLESASRSPIFSNFAETINGASSIRAYKACDRFYLDSQNKVDINNKCAFASDSAARWLKVRLEFLASILVFFACLFAVISTNVSASLAGLSITYALQVTAALNMLVQNMTMLETNSVSGERIVEYIGLPFEPDWIKPNSRPPSRWPDQGRISFVHYSTRYRPQLDLVLKSLSLSVKAGQKIGIVGRTGAGKSSLSLALFRVIEAAGGSIVIDDVDISTIGLHDLREALTILPQDPVLFSGTVRFNLDPFDRHSDEAIWKALDHAHLGDSVRELPGQLEYVCEEGGQNLSVGQRQLMCLARSLLRKTRILVLDEATAAVDLETDTLLQETIRTEFKDCTVLTVAHRLNTVIDYDKILVLSNGKILEFGSPSELLSKTTGTFYSMAKESGLV